MNMITQNEYLEAVRVVNQYLIQQSPIPNLENITSQHKHFISDMDLSFRLHKCLTKRGVMFLEELSGFTETDLFRMRNFGQSCFQELKEVMDENNIHNNWKK